MTDNRLEVFEEFVERVRNGESSFLIEHGDKYAVHFMSCEVGKAIYFYMATGYEKDFYVGSDTKYSFAAVVVGNEIYAEELYEFGNSHYENGIPDDFCGGHVHLLSEYWKSLNQYMGEVAFPAYYNTILPTRTNFVEDTLICDARARVFDSKETKKNNSHSIVTQFGIAFSRAEYMKILAFGLDLGEECKKKLDERKDTIDAAKSYEIALENLIKSGTIIEEYEVELANAVNSIDAKFVVAEFEHDGKRASAKIEPCQIISHLVDRHYFNSYSFQTDKMGTDMMKAIDASDSLWKDQDKLLYCKNITRVLFRGKPIYERN